jgi:hypothetical protein
LVRLCFIIEAGAIAAVAHIASSLYFIIRIMIFLYLYVSYDLKIEKPYLALSRFINN